MVIALTRIGAIESTSEEEQRCYLSRAVGVVFQLECPDLAGLRSGNENAKFGGDVVLLSVDRGFAAAMHATVGITLFIDRESGKSNAFSVLHEENTALADQRQTNGEAVLYEAVARTRLRGEGDVAVIPEVVVPVARNVGIGNDKIACLLIEMSVFSVSHDILLCKETESASPFGG